MSTAVKKEHKSARPERGGQATMVEAIRQGIWEEMERDPTVFVIGEGGLLAALHERKIASDAIRPRYVIVGEGVATMERLTKAHECIERGARLLATNPDNWCPVSSEKTRPGAGATAAFLESSTGRRACSSWAVDRLAVRPHGLRRPGVRASCWATKTPG